jgi:hypothetical protein
MLMPVGLLLTKTLGSSGGSGSTRLKVSQKVLDSRRIAQMILLRGNTMDLLSVRYMSEYVMDKEARANVQSESVTGDAIISPQNILQRPKVVYSKQTGEYHVRNST